MHTGVDACPARNVQHILRIVDGIYAAACGESTWDQALARICQLGQLDGGALSTVDALGQRRDVLAGCGLGCRAEAVGPHGATSGNSALVDRILKSTPGTVLQDRVILADQARVVRAAGMPVSGLVTWACVIVGRDDRRVVCLELYGRDGRAQGRPDPGDLLRQLAPHLVRAWRIGRASRSMLATPVRVASPSYSGAEAASAAHPAGLPRAARLRAEFGLTKAEARLALHLAEGASLASAAQAFNVKLTTTRSQLQQVFAKTGTSRQTELVAMLLSCGYGPLTHHWNLDRYAQPRLAVAG